MQNWLHFEKADNFTHGHFKTDGTEPSGTYNYGMMGANAVGSFAIAHSTEEDQALAKELVSRLWEAEPPTGKYRYNDGLVFFLSQLHVAGKFSLDFTE